MGWWIALGVIFLLGILPMGISARYSGEGPLLRVVIGPVRLTLFPRKKKEKKPKPAKKTAEQPKKQEEPLPKPPQPPKQEPAADKKEKGGSLLDFLPLLKVALNFLGDFRLRFLSCAPPWMKERIFTPFLRATPATSRSITEGLGRQWAI